MLKPLLSVTITSASTTGSSGCSPLTLSYASRLTRPIKGSIARAAGGTGVEYQWRWRAPPLY
ncbi:hypothetical protein O9992_24215 [Vibrio lentus]|nr:hypothetical protein [Vibrio lentus]